MAKFNIEIDLDWLDEEETLDSFIKSEVINQISSKIVEKAVNNIEDSALKNINEKINKALEGVEVKIDNKINEITENLLNRNITIYDRWGDPVKENVNIIDMFKEKMDNFLTEKVNSRGESSGYDRNQTRIDYLVNKNISYDMKTKVEYAAAEVGKKLKEYVDTKLKQEIGENVAKVIGLDNITNRIVK